MALSKGHYHKQTVHQTLVPSRPSVSDNLGFEGHPSWSE